MENQSDNYEPPDFNALANGKPLSNDSKDNYVPPDFDGIASKISSDVKDQRDTDDQKIKNALGLGGAGVGALAGYKGWSVPSVPIVGRAISTIANPGAGIFSADPNAAPKMETVPDTAYGTPPPEVKTSRQNYINSQLPDDKYVSADELEKLTGIKSNTLADTQKSISELSQKEPYTDFGLGELDPVTGKYNLNLNQVNRTIDLTPYNKPKYGTGIFADPESEEYKMAAQTKAADAAAAAKETAEAARNAKVTGVLRGIGNMAEKGFGLGALLHSVYDLYANQRDIGWGNVNTGTVTKGLSSLGGLAAMRGLPMVGGLMQVPEQTRQMVEDVEKEDPKVKRNAVLDWGNSGLD